MEMASSTLPSTQFTLTGGCFCKSIRYTISVPALDSRPFHQRPVRFPFGTQSEDAESPSNHWPVITFDHCNSCRHVSGSILQPWLICPTSWASWTLLSKTPKPFETDTKEGVELMKPTTLEVLKPSEELKSRTYVGYFSSSEDVNRIFCSKCGTGLTFFAEGNPEPKSWGPIFDIALGTLDDECLEMPGVKPTRQSWPTDGIGWVRSWLVNGEKVFSC